MYNVTGVSIVRSYLIMLEVTVNQLTVLSCINNALLQCCVNLRLCHNASVTAHQFCHFYIGRAVIYTNDHTFKIVCRIDRFLCIYISLACCINSQYTEFIFFSRCKQIIKYPV